MRQVIDGNGADSTAAVKAWLAANNELRLANLYMIGELEDPRTYFLTDWESPLNWPVYGIFQPTTIRSGSVTAKIGLDVDSLDIEWSPKTAAFTANLATANPYQRAMLGLLDNVPFRNWTVFMPTPGDANTFGACERFGGRITGIVAERDLLTMTITSFMDVVNQQVPTNVIELTNTTAAYSGATPQAGQTAVAKFSIITGSTQTKLITKQQSPDFDGIFSNNELRGGFIVFDQGGSQTLGAAWSAIYANTRITVSGHDYNEIVLYTALPWAPTPGTDTCYISRAFPLNQADSGTTYRGFPFVPNAASAI